MSARKRYLAALEAEFAAATHGAPLPDHDLAELRAEADKEKREALALCAYYMDETYRSGLWYSTYMRDHVPGDSACQTLWIDADDLRAALKSGATVEQLLAALDEATREGDR